VTPQQSGALLDAFEEAANREAFLHASLTVYDAEQNKVHRTMVADSPEFFAHILQHNTSKNFLHSHIIIEQLGRLKDLVKGFIPRDEEVSTIVVVGRVFPTEHMRFAFNPPELDSDLAEFLYDQTASWARTVCREEGEEKTSA